MDTSLKAARTYLFDDRSWASTGKTLDGRVNNCLLRALREIAGEVPEALVPEDSHAHIRKSRQGSDSDVDATITNTADMKVLKFTIAASSTWVPTVDGTWDGVMHLDITDPAGRVRRRQSREWWSDGATPATYYVSIDRPWFNTGSAPLEFRVYQPEFFLPANTTEVLTPLRLFDESEQMVGQISSGTARRNALPDYQMTVSSKPTDFWRGRFFQMPSPTEAPRVGPVLKDKDVRDPDNGSMYGRYLSWAGPVQEGEFEFCYTYAWGRVEAEWGESMGDFKDAVWESAPSPISAPFDHGKEFDKSHTGEEIGRAIVIECSNLEEMLDFVGDPLGIRLGSGYPQADVPLRFGRSGVKIRIYARRTQTYPDHGLAVTDATVTPKIIQATHRLNRTEADGKFYMLAELDPLALDPVLAAVPPMAAAVYKVSTFTWRGAPTNATAGQNNLAPDPTRQLRKTTGYYAYHLWPLPDQDYDLDISTLRQPKELVNDNDQLPIKQEAFEAFLELALAYMSRLDGVDQSSEMKHRHLYKGLVKRFKSQHGDNNGIVENSPWGGIRPTFRYGSFQEG